MFVKNAVLHIKVKRWQRDARLGAKKMIRAI